MAQSQRYHSGMKKTAGGTPDAPWALKTPPGTAEYQAWRDPSLDPPALVVQVGKTQLRYHLAASTTSMRC